MLYHKVISPVWVVTNTPPPPPSPQENHQKKKKMKENWDHCLRKDKISFKMYHGAIGEKVATVISFCFLNLFEETVLAI